MSNRSPEREDGYYWGMTMIKPFRVGMFLYRRDYGKVWYCIDVGWAYYENEVKPLSVCLKPPMHLLNLL